VQTINIIATAKSRIVFHSFTKFAHDIGPLGISSPRVPGYANTAEDSRAVEIHKESRSLNVDRLIVIGLNVKKNNKKESEPT
jgi:hypothetical protein